LPKIVLDIQNIILAVAETHFKEHGFEETDMRKIASDAKIAVGTLYLHHKNKETLYHHVIESSWKATIDKIEMLSKQEIDPKETLKQILLELIHDMTNRKSISSLWMEIGAMYHFKETDMTRSHHFSGPHNSISTLISAILLKLALKHQTPTTEPTLIQLGRFAIIMTVDICMQESSNIENRVDLIIDLLSSYLCKTDPQNLNG
jgi:AcrR family transcriptional regulator